MTTKRIVLFRRPALFHFLVAALFLMVAGRSANALEYYGISRPSSEAALGFTVSGRVTSVLVKDGDFVAPGDLLAEQDGSVLDARIAQLRLESGSMVEVDASKAELAQMEQDLKKMTQAHQRGAATDLERERAQLEVVISRYRVKAAEEKREMAGLKLKEAEAEREQLYLRSPVGGRIEALKLNLGEAPKPMEPVLMVVNVDPMWVEVPTPLATAAKLDAGTPVTVRYHDGKTARGSVLFISSVADAASETVMVRLVVPNSEKRRVGERVGIILSTEVASLP